MRAFWLLFLIGAIPGSSECVLAAEDIDLPEPACTPHPEVQIQLANAEGLVQSGAFESALQALDQAAGFTPNEPCEAVLIAIKRLEIFANTDDFMAAVDSIESVLSSGLLPDSDISVWKAHLAAAKLRAKEARQAETREDKKRLKVTDDERLALNWYFFRNGKFTFAADDGMKGAMLGALVRLGRSGASDVSAAESYLINRQWKSLAEYVMDSRIGTGYDIDYFYLASAAAGLGFEGAARSYAGKAIELSSKGGMRTCSRHEVSGTSRWRNYCAGHRAATESKRLISALDQAAAERARLQAEQIRKEEEAAKQAAALAQAAEERRLAAETQAAAAKARRDALAAKYPVGWVDDILSGRVQVGMTREAVRDAKGPPVRTEKIDPQEMWIYGSERIIFTDDEVTFVDR